MLMMVQPESCISGFCPHCGVALSGFACLSQACVEKRRIRKAIREAEQREKEEAHG